MTVPGSDNIFDSFLEEMLTNQHPPDLSEQIAQRWREELGPVRWQSMQARLQADSPRKQSPLSRRSHVSSWTSALVAVTALAAGLLFALTAWRLWPMTHSLLGGGGSIAKAVPQPIPRTLPVGDNGPSENPMATSAKSTVNDSLVPTSTGGPLTAANDSTISTRSTRSTTAKELPLDNLPFDSNRKQSHPSTEKSASAVASVERWSDDQVVSWIDKSFEKLWTEQGLSLTRGAAKDDIASRVSLILTGAPATTTPDSPRELASRLLKSATFAEHWADRIVTHWLRGTAAGHVQDQAGAALRSFLAQEIVARKSWNQVLASLINSSPDQPQATFLASLAGGDNHRLAGRIGSVVLDEALACARCHDASENGRVISTDQDEYWSLVAILTGVEGRASQPGSGQATRVLVDQQLQLFGDGKSPNVFFERPDGRLQAALYRLPEGDVWRTIEDARTPRESLARWISSSTVSDQAAVNLAWRMVFGRPLVAQHAALDGAGHSQRQEILSMLANQFQAHDRDMTRLIEWLVTSAPFATQPLDIDRQSWLLASESQIENWNKATANFASFVRPASTAAPRSLETALASVIRWSGSDNQPQATLAQPALVPDASRRPQGNASKSPADDEPLPTYMVRSVQATPAQDAFISRLVASKLSWPEQVEHIAGLVGESTSQKLQRTADQLLESKNGNRASALFQLLQGALLVEEAL